MSGVIQYDDSSLQILIIGSRPFTFHFIIHVIGSHRDCRVNHSFVRDFGHKFANVLIFTFLQ